MSAEKVALSSCVTFSVQHLRLTSLSFALISCSADETALTSVLQLLVNGGVMITAPQANMAHMHKMTVLFFPVFERKQIDVCFCGICVRSMCVCVCDWKKVIVSDFVNLFLT